MGTGAQESRFTYIDQIVSGPGPAYGLWQMERPTHDDHWRWLSKYPALHEKVESLLAEWPTKRHFQLHTNLSYAAAMCRLHYYRVDEALPAADDIVGLGRYWKKYYNTVAGKGTVDQFCKNYRVLNV